MGRRHRLRGSSATQRDQAVRGRERKFPKVRLEHGPAEHHRHIEPGGPRDVVSFLVKAIRMASSL